MDTLLFQHSIYEAYLFIDGKNRGTVLAQFMGRKPEGHGLFAMLVSEPPAGCDLKGKSILTFSSYIGKNGDEIYVVTPDDELPDRLEF